MKQKLTTKERRRRQREHELLAPNFIYVPQGEVKQHPEEADEIIELDPLFFISRNAIKANSTDLHHGMSAESVVNFLIEQRGYDYAGIQRKANGGVALDEPTMILVRRTVAEVRRVMQEALEDFDLMYEPKIEMPAKGTYDEFVAMVRDTKLA